MKNPPRVSAWCALALAGASFLIVTPEAHGQRGGGGGRGRGSGGFSATPPQSPMSRVREELKVTDYLQFLDDKGKQVGLEKAQKDSVKSLSKQMDEEEKPVFKEMEKMFSDLERSASQGGGQGGEAAGGRGGGRGRGGMPEGVRELMVRMTTIQDGYASKAQALLTESQKPIADSLHTIYQEDLKERQRKRSRG